MSISINDSLLRNSSAILTQGSSKTSSLESALTSTELSQKDEEELLEVCKSFESYFVEQVYKEMKKTVHSSDEDSEYLQYFGDMMIEKYAEDTTEGGGLGIAQMLYESMKRE